MATSCVPSLEVLTASSALPFPPEVMSRIAPLCKGATRKSLRATCRAWRVAARPVGIRLIWQRSFSKHPQHQLNFQVKPPLDLAASGVFILAPIPTLLADTPTPTPTISLASLTDSLSFSPSLNFITITAIRQPWLDWKWVDLHYRQAIRTCRDCWGHLREATVPWNMYVVSTLVKHSPLTSLTLDGTGYAVEDTHMDDDDYEEDEDESWEGDTDSWEKIDEDDVDSLGSVGRKKLVVDGNRAVEACLQELQNCVGLRSLDVRLDENQSVGIEDYVALRQLTQLQSLTVGLSDTEGVREESQEFGTEWWRPEGVNQALVGLTGLTQLTLKMHQVDPDCPLVLSHLTSLLSFTLHLNEDSPLLEWLTSLSTCTQLTTLASPQQSVPPETLAPLQHLKHLEMCWDSTDFSEAAGHICCDHLTHLHVSTFDLPASFATTLSSLQELCTEGLYCQAPLSRVTPNLRSLALRGYIGFRPDCLIGLTRLASIHLPYAELANPATLQVLGAIPSLWELGVHGSADAGYGVIRAETPPTVGSLPGVRRLHLVPELHMFTGKTTNVRHLPDLVRACPGLTTLKVQREHHLETRWVGPGQTMVAKALQQATGAIREAQSLRFLEVDAKLLLLDRNDVDSELEDQEPGESKGNSKGHGSTGELAAAATAAAAAVAGSNAIATAGSAVSLDAGLSGVPVASAGAAASAGAGAGAGAGTAAAAGAGAGIGAEASGMAAAGANVRAAAAAAAAAGAVTSTSASAAVVCASHISAVLERLADIPPTLTEFLMALGRSQSLLRVDLVAPEGESFEDAAYHARGSRRWFLREMVQRQVMSALEQQKKRPKKQRIQFQIGLL